MEEFPAVSPDDVAKAMVELAEEPTTLMFHAEMYPQEHTDTLSGPRDQYKTFLDSRPVTFETDAIEEILRLSHLAPRLPLHIVHLSAVESLPLLRAARQRGVNITAETCFHYLSLAAEAIKAGDTRHKCCPPIRSQSNQDGLWSEMLESEDAYSVIKTVVSDHSPCTPNLKLLPAHLAVEGTSLLDAEGSEKGDFMSAWGGIGSVGLGLSILWTEGRAKGVDATHIVRWCCKNTAKQVGLEHCKGDLAVGLDADIAVFDDEAEFVVQKSTMLFRNKCSPYENKTLQGVVKETWLGGRRVFTREGGFSEEGPLGKLLVEPRT